MALILNIESSTAACSVALGQAGQVLGEEQASAAYQHASQLTLLIDTLLKKANKKLADLDAVAVSMGPGSFTALRVGMSTAKGICFALNKPLIGISSLKALAQGLLSRLSEEELNRSPLLCPMIDARRMEVYTNLYKLDLSPLGADEARIIEENSYKGFFQSKQYVIFTGDGCDKCRHVITDPQALFYPSAANATHMIPLSEEAYQAEVFLDPAYAEPFYLKLPNITTPKKLL